MRERCWWSCNLKNRFKGESNGWRATFFYPGGGNYKGYWQNSKHEFYGVKSNKDGLIYDGQWSNGNRHGYGTMRKQQNDGIAERVYVGRWQDDMKCGEGKQFDANGVYYGWFQNNRRHGVGCKWYKDGSIYMGEWEADVQHGVGVYFYVNGNRYEGHFARGFKNGEGTFYHMHTGQIQKGMWEDDICKTSIVTDEFRHQVDQPTEYPIPKSYLAEPDLFIRELFQKYLKNGYKPTKNFNELSCLNFVHKKRKNAKFEPKAISNSKIRLEDIHFPCTCKKPEKLLYLKDP